MTPIGYTEARRVQGRDLRRVGERPRRQSIYLHLLIGSVLVGVFIAGCDVSSVPEGSTVPAPRMGGTWTAVRIADMPAVPMGEPRIQFTLGGQVHGETGCSDFEGPFTVEGNFLAIGPLKSGFSDPQCRVAPRQQEQAFLAVFRTADRIEELGRGRLRLSGPDGEILLLREGNFDLTADEAALLAQLREGPWSIVEATGSPSELRLPPLEFENSDFSAIGPCGITGSYRLRGDDLIQLHGISPSEVEACPAENDRLRTRLIDNLAMITTMKFDDPGRLTFRGTEVELILERP